MLDPTTGAMVMADLSELHAALGALRQSGKTAKVSFYYTLNDDLKMRSGSIFVESGAACYVSFMQLPADDALEDVAALSFAKVATLPAISIEHSGDSVPIDFVLEKLDPALRPQIEPTPVPISPYAFEAPPAEVVRPEEVSNKPAHVFYSHESTQKEAQALLETLFGFGAHKKVEEFALSSPPVNYPVEFLRKCQKHAAMMIGEKKAESLFKPLLDKLPSSFLR